MNQILVTEKIIVTPELRRKKKMYKIQFFFCVFLVCLLFSYYIYAEYDRDKSEEVSHEILAGIEQQAIKNKNTSNNKTKTDTTVKKDNIIVVALDDNREEVAAAPQVIEESEAAPAIEYTAENGVNYTIESRITIPCLGIDYPVLSETSEELLKIAINKYWGPAPNTVGNYCVVGHNYKSKKMFGRLSEAENGDIVELTDYANGIEHTVQYEIYERYVVEPTDTSCTSQLTNGRRELTLITCTNYGQQRLVVKAREI